MRPVDLAEVAERRARRPELPLWKPLGEWLDAFYDASPARQQAMLAREPVATLDAPEAAYLAAAAEHLSSLYGLNAPTWVDHARYFLDVAYWPGGPGRAFETICLAESPVSFRRRFIFTEAHPLRRKRGPRLPTQTSP